MGRAAKLRKERKSQKLHSIVSDNLETVEGIEHYTKELRELQSCRLTKQLPNYCDSLEGLEACILDTEHIVEIFKILKDKYLESEDAFELAEKEFSETRENYVEERKLINKYMI